MLHRLNEPFVTPYLYIYITVAWVWYWGYLRSDEGGSS